MRRFKSCWLLAATTLCVLLAACAAQPQRTASGPQGPENYPVRSFTPPLEALGPDGLPLARGIPVPAFNSA